MNNTTGRAKLIPDKAVVDEEKTIALVYTAGENGIKKGGSIKISVFGRNAVDNFQTENTQGPGHVYALSSKGDKLEVLAENLNLNRTVTVKVKKDIRPYEEVRIIFCLKMKPYTHQNVFNVRLDVWGDKIFLKLPDPPVLTIKNEKVDRLIAILPSTVIVNSPVELLVKAVDKFGNIVKDYKGRISLLSPDIKASLPQEYIFLKEDKGMHIFKDIKFSVAGIQTVKIKDEEKSLTAESNPVEVSAEEPKYHIFWGEIHGHTMLSDGLETPDCYFKWARDMEKLDFSALTDHAYGNDLEELDTPSLTDSDKNMAWRKDFPSAQFPFYPGRIARWAITKYVTHNFNQPGKFVTLLGYEWTGGHKGVVRCGNHGHKNVYYLDDDGPCINYADEEGENPDRLWDTLKTIKGERVITIAHHPAYPQDFGVTGTDWSFHSDDIQPLVEIYSKHGCSESSDSPYPLIKQAKGQYVQDALARGYKLGITAGSDTHISRPGSECPEASKELQYKSGLTAVFAEELTRQGIFEALKKKRCYGTTHPRIILRFEINGHIMGEEITARDERKIKIKVAGTNKIKNIDIIRNNQNVYIHKGEKNTEEFEYIDQQKISEILDDFSIRVIFYYVRVTQIDGEMAWSSPIWIKRIEQTNSNVKDEV